MDIILSGFLKAFYFVAMISVLVFVHEAGHFLFAKLFKVKVHAFSLGFGPKLFSFKRGETDYKICAVPVGGYVRMLGEDPTEKVGPEDTGRAFGDKALWQRALIILAGPAMNLALPLLIYFGLGLAQTEVVPAEVGYAVPGTPAYEAGMRPGDVVVSVGGEPVEQFSDLTRLVEPRPGVSLPFRIRRGDRELNLTLAPQPVEIPYIPGLSATRTVGRIGVSPGYLRSIVGVRSVDSAAAKAGLSSLDYVIAVDQKPIERLVDLERALLENADKSVQLTVRRFRRGVDPSSTPWEEYFEKTPESVTVEVPAGVTKLSDLGLEDATLYVAHVVKGGPADEVGLEHGDRLLALGGEELTSGHLLAEKLHKNPQAEFALAWERGGERFERPYKQKVILADEAGKDLGVKRDDFDRGFYIIGGQVAPELIANPSLLATAARQSWRSTWDGMVLIGMGFKLLFTGEISFESLGGPVMIGQLAAEAGERGAGTFFFIMAIISLNLGLINLLPIPVLDGGHLMMISVEAVTRRAFPSALKEKMMLAGLVFIVALLVFATRNDIARLFVD